MARSLCRKEPFGFARQNGAELLLGQGQITDRAVNEGGHHLALHRK
jgi:hypothetical protein